MKICTEKPPQKVAGGNESGYISETDDLISCLYVKTPAANSRIFIFLHGFVDRATRNFEGGAT